MKSNLLRTLLCLSFALSAGGLFAASEDDLIAKLKKETSPQAVGLACQELRAIGSAKAVPALAELLGREGVSQAARHALEGIGGPEAAKALREALPKTTGADKAGIIHSLGACRDAAAVPALTRLAGDADAVIASAAAISLGRIGGNEALAALMEARKSAQGSVQTTMFQAILECADGLATRDSKRAIEAYNTLLGTTCQPVRAAAWRSLVLADGRKRSTLVLAGLKGSDPVIEQAARSFLQETADASLIKSCARQWPQLTPQAQIALVKAAAGLGGSLVSVVRTAQQSADPSVRTASWAAMASLAEPSDIPRMAEAAALGDVPEREAAHEALARAQNRGVQKAITGAIEKSEPPVQAVLLQILGERGDKESIPVLMRYAGQRTEPARTAALDSLGALASMETAVPLLKMAAQCETDQQANPVLSALFAVCQPSADKGALTRQMLPAIGQLNSSGRDRVLPVLAELGTPEALEVASAAARNSDSASSKIAVETLSQWPNASAARPLLDVARASSNPSQRILAVRGAIAVASRETDPAARLAILRDAANLAGRNEEKVQVLGQVGQIASPYAITAALGYMSDPGVKNEAGLAAITIAEKLSKTHPALAQKTAATVLASSQSPEILRRAWSIRGASGGNAPFIQDWLVCGPFRKSGVKDALTALSTPVGPEISGEQVQWAAAPKGDRLHLAALFPRQDNCAAFAKAALVAPEAMDAMLLMGSDDGIMAWVNGTLVHSNNVDRGEVQDQDIAPIRLRQGMNELMLKISQGGGGWSASARIVSTAGGPIEGLQIIAPAGAPAAKPAAAPAVVKETPSELPPRESFKKLHLTNKFYAEGAYYADFNRDGHMDVVAGPFWFAGPAFEKSSEYRPVKEFNAPTEYSDNFLTFTGEFNGDSWPDILCVPFPGKEGYWYENPAGKEGHWKQHLAYTNIGNESPMWGDVDGDGGPELLLCNDGFLGYANPDPRNPEKPWEFKAVSKQDKRYQRFTHGIGYGDLNGDGRVDILEALGWWEQPENLNTPGPWNWHPFTFAEAAAQMLVYDVNGDGLQDVITAWHCHQYGMVWWEQVKGSNGADWKSHEIITPAPDLSSSEFRVSQLHALDLVDMNGDGLKDILTGKRFWSHGPTGDKEPSAPAVVFWFELQRDAGKNVKYVPRLVDDDSGVGTQVAAADLNKDGRPDVMVANKKGIFLHLSQKPAGN